MKIKLDEHDISCLRSIRMLPGGREYLRNDRLLKAWPPHGERVGALIETGYTANRVEFSSTF